jgi:integrase/recombinase XerC
MTQALSRTAAVGGSRSIVETFLAGRSPRTLEAYARDLADFARFTEVPSPEQAAHLLLARGKAEAEGLAHAYRSSLIARHLSPATVNRRLATLRSITKLGRLLNFADFFLEVASVKSEPYRDTRGPGREGVWRLLQELAHRKAQPRHCVKATRDYALLHLLYDLALRRGEATALDLADVNNTAGTISILAKGKTEKEALTLPEPTNRALAEWLSVRGTEPGPLFVNLDPAHKGHRLTGRSVARILAALGKQAGLVARVRPHGLRHAAITCALDLTNGNLRVVQKFSRHKDPAVIGRYDDNRRDLGGEVARLVAEQVESVLSADTKET